MLNELHLYEYEYEYTRAPSRKLSVAGAVPGPKAKSFHGNGATNNGSHALWSMAVAAGTGQREAAPLSHPRPRRQLDWSESTSYPTAGAFFDGFSSDFDSGYLAI
ncbi:hypothetical protein ACLKA7_007994 [Drosophila subpalustris]